MTEYEIIMDRFRINEPFEFAEEDEDGDIENRRPQD